ncbi:MAG: hypothetical protein JNG83_10705 [Opitutaceae bacterium]|nr:hypothetical protein [Opitutaceae bacterium]
MPLSVPRWFRLLAFAGLAALGLAARAAPLLSPELHADRRVTFRYAGPEQGPVELIGRGPGQHHDFPEDTYAMTRGADGVWEVTVGPLLPSLYWYRFRVAGTEVVDPVNGSVHDFFAGPWSQVEVPDPAPQPWQPSRAVPAGRVEIRRISTQGAVGWDRPVYVYLPPGYRDDAPEPLPVVYLFHGWDFNERSWIEDGRVPTILDNLIAAGRARPMAVVMPLGFSFVPLGVPHWPADEEARWREQIVAGLIPWIEKNYRVGGDRRNRALAGFSMGGKNALVLALGDPTLTAWVAAFSSGRNGLRNYPERYEPARAPDAPRMRLIWLGWGNRDLYADQARTLVERLRADGFSVTAHESDGRHTWRVWRDSFSAFAQRVFRPEEVEQGRHP